MSRSTILFLLLLSIFLPNLAFAKNYATLCEEAGGTYFGAHGSTPRDCVCESGSDLMWGKSIDGYWTGLGGGFAVDCYVPSCDALGHISGNWGALASDPYSPQVARTVCESQTTAASSYYLRECQRYCGSCAYSFGLYRSKTACEVGWSWKYLHFQAADHGDWYCDCA